MGKKKLFFKNNKPTITYGRVYIGGVQNRLNTPELIAAKFSGLNEGVMINFRVGASFVYFETPNLFRPGPSSFQNSTDITYILDIDGFMSALGYDRTSFDFSLMNAVNLKNVICEKALFVGRQATQQTIIEEFYLPKTDFIGTRDFYLPTNNAQNSLVIYTPLLTSLQDVTYSDSSSAYNNSTWYCNPIFDDGVGGVTNAYLQTYIDKGGTVVWVLNTTPPEAITNFIISNISYDSVQVDFDVPVSVNGILKYNVFLDDFSDNPLKEFVKNKDETSNSFVLDGLDSLVSYRIKVVPNDIYLNRNTDMGWVEFSTIEFPSVPLPLGNILSDYKMDGNLNDSQGLNDGVFGGTGGTFQPGVINEEVVFDGLGWVKIDNSSKIYSFTNATKDLPYSVSTILNKNNSTGSMIACIYDVDKWLWYFYISGGKLVVYCVSSNANYYLKATSVGSISTNKDTSLIMTSSGLGEADRFNLYIDGIQQALVLDTHRYFTKMDNVSGVLTLGASAIENSTLGLVGSQDETIFWNAELTPSQARTVAVRQLKGEEINP